MSSDRRIDDRGCPFCGSPVLKAAQQPTEACARPDCVGAHGWVFEGLSVIPFEADCRTLRRDQAVSRG